MTATSRLLAIAETIDLAHHELCDVAEGLIQATAPTEPAPGLEVAADAPSLVTLPTVDEIAEVIANDDAAQDLSPDYAWSGMGESTRECFRHNARAVLDLLEARVPRWVRIEPGTVVKAGTRYRTEGDVWAQEKSRDADWTPPPEGMSTSTRAPFPPSLRTRR